MKCFRIILAAGILVAAMGSMALAYLPQGTPNPANLTGLHDFDFLVGEWRVHHRVKRPALNDQWLEFDGTCSNRNLMGGGANVEDHMFAWKAHSKAANATMVDASNVLLLRPTRPTSGFSLEKLLRPASGSTDGPKRLVIGTIYYFDENPGNDFIDFFESEVAPVLRDSGASIIGRFVTESSTNTFPALPVREGEQVFVFFSAFRNAAAYERYLAELGRSRRWNGGTLKALSTRIKRPPEILRLSPTARSLVGR